eukprot:1301592-Pyramimonas_sp.AAC.1
MADPSKAPQGLRVASVTPQQPAAPMTGCESTSVHIIQVSLQQIPFVLLQRLQVEAVRVPR